MHLTAPFPQMECSSSVTLSAWERQALQHLVKQHQPALSAIPKLTSASHACWVRSWARFSRPWKGEIACRPFAMFGSRILQSSWSSWTGSMLVTSRLWPSTVTAKDLQRMWRISWRIWFLPSFHPFHWANPSIQHTAYSACHPSIYSLTKRLMLWHVLNTCANSGRMHFPFWVAASQRTCFIGFLIFCFEAVYKMIWRNGWSLADNDSS